MAEKNKSWVLMVTAQTPTNIAVIKYWGKRDETLILPINDSISVTLDPAHLCTTTTVAVSPSFTHDRMWLNGKEISLSGGRYQNCLREIRSRAGDVEDEDKGIKIAKKDWENLHLHIASYNNFPTAAGLASSAAGFACLVFSLAKLMNVKEDNSRLSAIASTKRDSFDWRIIGVLHPMAGLSMCTLLFTSYMSSIFIDASTTISFVLYLGYSIVIFIKVFNLGIQMFPHAIMLFALAIGVSFQDFFNRQGSGSACRSLYGGFVKWIMGKDEKGSDSTAVQLVDEKHWDSLVILIAVVSSRQKETSSTSGMRETVETSPLVLHRAKEVVPKRIIEMEKAIQSRDFPAFARLTCSDSNQFHAVCLDTSPPIFYMNDTSHRIISCVEKWNHSEGTPQVAYTFDAGPNAVLIARDRKAAALLLQRLLFYFPPQSDVDINSYIVGDKSILQDAGIQDLRDVEALSPPPETKDNIQTQKYRGDVSYFICTRPGRGPVLLTEDSQALLNPETGLPK